jgi:hypothetical protein
MIHPFNPADDEEYSDCREEAIMRNMVGVSDDILKLSKFGWSNIYPLLRQLDRLREQLSDKNAEIMYLKDRLGSIE